MNKRVTINAFADLCRLLFFSLYLTQLLYSTLRIACRCLCYDFNMRGD